MASRRYQQLEESSDETSAEVEDILDFSPWSEYSFSISKIINECSNLQLRINQVKIQCDLLKAQNTKLYNDLYEEENLTETLQEQLLLYAEQIDELIKEKYDLEEKNAKLRIKILLNK
jgi:hypothetical protein